MEQTLDEDIQLSTRERTVPSPAERLAHVLPGRSTQTDRVNWDTDTKLRNQVQLSVYPDCIGPEGGDKTIAAVDNFVRKHLEGVVGGVHILPCYPSTADRGFSPTTHTQIAKQHGTWDDVKSISADYDLCLDYMVNHISRQCDEFQDFLKKGDDSEFASLFIRYCHFFDFDPSCEDLRAVYTRSPDPPFIEVELANGSKEKVWNTFTEEQIDVDVFSDKGKEFITKQISAMCPIANLVRLDAFGYTTKRKGTNCFFVQPDVWELLHFVQDQLHCKNSELLCEVHDHYVMQKALSEHNIWAYDFALPFLLLQTLYDADADNLKAWWHKCPRNQVTTLDTHDGIGVIDCADLMTQAQCQRTKDRVFANGGNANNRYNPVADSNEVYQLNITYMSALEDDERWYLLARALQFFTPGIPLVYYVGLFAGTNAVELAEETGTGRDINRKPYTDEEAVHEMKRPVVKTLMDLCKFRNSHPAFDGTFKVLDHIEDIKPLQSCLSPEDRLSESSFLTDKLGIPADVAGASCGRSWYIDGILEGKAVDRNTPPVNGVGANNDNPDREVDEDEKLFHPCSAALQNAKNALQSPAEMALGKKISVKERSYHRRRALLRSQEQHVPRDVICCEWKSGNGWAVLEVDLQSKDGRILFSEGDRVGVFDIASVLKGYSKSA